MDLIDRESYLKKKRVFWLFQQIKYKTRLNAMEIWMLIQICLALKDYLFKQLHALYKQVLVA